MMTPAPLLDTRSNSARTKWCARALVDLAEMLTWELLRPDALPLVRYICRVTWDISDCVADLALAAEQINTHLVAARSRGVVTGEESNFGEASDALGRVSSGLVEIRKELERAYFSAGALYDSLGEE